MTILLQECTIYPTLQVFVPYPFAHYSMKPRASLVTEGTLDLKCIEQRIPTKPLQVTKWSTMVIRFITQLATILKSSQLIIRLQYLGRDPTITCINIQIHKNVGCIHTSNSNVATFSALKLNPNKQKRARCVVNNLRKLSGGFPAQPFHQHQG